MAASSTSGGHYFFLAALCLLLSSAAYGQLSEQYYATKCSSLDEIVKTEVSSALATEKRMGASLLRLFFHDCFVQGCDASVLLDSCVAFLTEKTATPNANSLRGFDVIDRIKAKVEAKCPGVVSCADILALAARESVIELGGQGWPLSLGRRDSLTANQAEANTLPSPNSDIDTLILAFQQKNFTAEELVALSGAHTIGKAKCKNADSSQQNRYGCNNSSSVLLPLDVKTEETFDEDFYQNLPSDGLLHSDRVLVNRTELKKLVGKYASNKTLFFEDFGRAMTKLSEMKVPGAIGEIRRNCSRVN